MKKLTGVLKQKKVIIGVVVGVLLIGAYFIFGGNSKKLEQKADVAAKDDGIKYFEVPDFDQVYINGVIQPDQMESFSKDNKMTSEPEIKVENGATVEAGAVLYTYEDKEVTKQIEEQENTIGKLNTKKTNINAKWNRAVANFNKTPIEERSGTKATIDEQHQTELDAANEEIAFANSTIQDLKTKQFVSTTAKFTGQVSIPEVKDENTPILRLTSGGLYMSGKVNEKDLPKISLEQPATIMIVSNGQTVAGKISYIDNNPPENASQDKSENSTNASMSSYAVKLSLDSTEGIKNGYHAQATISLGDNKPVEVPSSAIHDQDGVQYVLVNDFGSVIRRVVKVGEKSGDKTPVTFGLESGDRIIVSSKKELKEGDIIEGEVASEEAAK